MTRSSQLYLKRKKRILGLRDPRPQFATKTLKSHRRPHVALPELRVKEDPGARLATRLVEETPAYVPTGEAS